MLKCLDTQIIVKDIDIKLYNDIFSSTSLIIMDINVFKYLSEYIDLSNYQIIQVEWCEEDKSWATVEKLLDNFLELGIKRDGSVLAVGGGLVSDVVGFAASVYMRGISWSVISTTLLSQVDACLGGKVAVNGRSIKNIYGSFHSPKNIYCDVKLLNNLSDRDYCSGLAEACKYGIALDDKFFDWLDNNKHLVINRDSSALTILINKCLQIKSFVIELDYRDTHGKREILNFGHTFAHGLESVSNGDLRHGEAVAIGMKLACKLSVQLGLLSSHEYERILQLLAYFKLNIPYDIRPISLLYDVMLKDKKGKSNDSLRLILSNGIGKAIGVDDFKLKDLKALELSHAEC